jgi:hypothetical protein
MSPKTVTPDSSRGRPNRPGHGTAPAARAKEKKAPEPAAKPKPQKASVQKTLVMRAEAATDSDKSGDLPKGTSVYVLEVREIAPGTKRAQVAMSETAPPLGWVTAVKDGEENLVYEPPMSARASPRRPLGSDPAKSVGSPATRASQPEQPGRKVLPGPTASSSAGATAARAAAENNPRSSTVRAATSRPANSFMSTTKSSTNATADNSSAAARRRSRIKKPVEETPVLENADDFDWAAAGGGCARRHARPVAARPAASVDLT